MDNNGDLYIGNYKNGFRDGLGKLVAAGNSWYYDGGFKDGKFHGEG